MRCLAAAFFGWMTIWLGLTFLTELSGRFRDAQYASASELPSPQPLLEGSGAIVYFREGTGQMNPYLLFVRSGRVGTKTLSFTSESTCVVNGRLLQACPRSVPTLMRQMGAGPVYVKGVVRNEAVLVEEMRPSTPEAAGLTIVSLSSGEEVSIGEFLVKAVPYGDGLLDLTAVKGEESRQDRIYSGEITRVYSDLYVSYAMFDAEKEEYVLVIIMRTPEKR